MSKQADLQRRATATGPVNTLESILPPLGSAINVLMIWPRFPCSFWSFDGVRDLVPVETDQPPLGLLTVAALCPKNWRVRLID